MPKSLRMTSNEDKNITSGKTSKAKKEPLRYDQWLDMAIEFSDWWSKKWIQEGLQDWYEYKESRNELYTSAVYIKSLFKMFKDKESCFPVSVNYAILNELRGVYPKDWLAKEELQSQRQADTIRKRNSLLNGDTDEER